MIGRQFWIVVWYGILLLGILGCGAAVHWGRRTDWRNLDEVFRALGTILVSLGMILLLYRLGPAWSATGRVLLVTALASFVIAFFLGRRPFDRSDTRTQ